MSNPLLYPLVAAAARLVLPRMATVNVEGLEHLPRSGPALLLPNHQSALDPFVVQAWAPREVRSMTKSTQFGTPFMGWVVPRLGGFPVRRFRVDPPSVRTVLRLLEDGACVCIYPEGERSWDGQLQPLRRGTLRVAIRAMSLGVPVLPVGLDGLLDLLPRWGRVRRPPTPLYVRFGAPLKLGPDVSLGSRRARDAALPGFERALTAQLRLLSGEQPAATLPGWEEILGESARTEEEATGHSAQPR